MPTTYFYGPDVPLTMQPLDAPRPITREEAETIADAEYAYRRASHGGDWLCLAWASGGYWHPWHTAYSEGAARGWRDEKRRGLAARIMRGEMPLSLFYGHGRDRFYLG